MRNRLWLGLVLVNFLTVSIYLFLFAVDPSVLRGVTAGLWGAVTVINTATYAKMTPRAINSHKPIDWHWVREQEMEVWGEYFSELKCEPKCKKCEAEKPKPIPPKGRGASSPARTITCDRCHVVKVHAKGRMCQACMTEHFEEEKKKTRTNYDNGLKIMQLCKICENRRVAGRDTCNDCLKKGVYSPDTLKKARGREDRRQVTLPSGRRIVRPNNVPSFATATEQHNPAMMRDEVVWSWGYDDTGSFTFRQGLPDDEGASEFEISPDLSTAKFKHIKYSSEASNVIPLITGDANIGCHTINMSERARNKRLAARLNERRA